MPGTAREKPKSDAAISRQVRHAIRVVTPRWDAGIPTLQDWETAGSGRAVILRQRSLTVELASSPSGPHRRK